MLTSDEFRAALARCFRALRGERWPRVELRGRTLYVTHDGARVQYPGFVRWGARHFWPDYDARAAYRKRRPKPVGGDGSAGASMRGAFTSREEYRAYKSARGGEERGIQLGLRVHGELEKYANMPIEQFREENPTLHNLTQVALRALLAEHILPVRGEVPFFNEFLGVASIADCLGVSMRTGRVVVIEYKTTGNREGFMAASGVVRGPFRIAMKDSSAAQQGVAQALLAQITFCTRYGLECDGRVLLVHERGHEWVKGKKIPNANTDTLRRLENDIALFLKVGEAPTPYMKYLAKRRRRAERDGTAVKRRRAEV